MIKVFSLIAAMLCTMHTMAIAEISGSLTASYFFYPNSMENSFKDDVSAELKAMGQSSLSHDWELEYELVFRKSREDKGKNIIEPRQLFLRKPFEPFDFFIGNRQVFWGVTESKNVVDFINQADSASGNTTEDKLGASSISADFFVSDAEIQYFFIPYFRQRTFNDQNAHPGLGLPLNPATFSDEKGRMGGDHALRFSNSIGDFDIGLSGFYGTARGPILIINSNGTATPYYPEYKALGFDIQYTGDRTLYKAEFANGKQDESNVIAYVAGFESTLYSIAGSSWDIGIIGELQYDNRKQAAAKKFNTGGVRLAANNASDTTLLVLYSLDGSGNQSNYSAQFSHRLNNGLKVEAEYTEFYSSKIDLPFFNLIDDTYFQLSIGYYF